MKNNKKKETNPQVKIEDINKTLAEAWSILEKIDSLDFNKDIDIKSLQKESDELLEKVHQKYKPLIDKIDLNDEKE